MALRYNSSLRCYVLYCNDVEAANDSGLTLSRSTRGPNGELAWYTAEPGDAKTPTDNPYAVLPFYDQGDDQSRQRLYPLWRDFQASWSLKSDSSYPCPAGEKYDPYQIAAVDYAMDKGNVIIGDPPGVGKTIEALALANAREAQKTLVFCPATIRPNWVKQIRRWTCLPNPIIHPIMKSSHGVNPMANFVVSSYNMALNPGIFSAMLSTHWDLVITDEGHFLKNYDAQRTQRIFGGYEGKFKHDFIANRSDQTVSLTGTPLPNRPRECYTHARAFDWSCIDFSSEDSFRWRFNPSMRFDKGVREESGREAELGARLRCNIMIRRDKEQLLPDLPDLRLALCYIEENGNIKDVLAKEKLIDFDPTQIRNPDFVSEGQISTVRREMGVAKIPRIYEHMKYLLDIVEKPKVVLFCYHREVMAAMNELLQPYGITCVQGGMTPNSKQLAIDIFVKKKETRVIALQLTAGGFGVDELQTVCDHAVLAEIDWTPGTNEQALQRVHRRGQHNNVLGEFLVVENSWDEQVLSSTVFKAQNVHKTLDRRY